MKVVIFCVVSLLFYAYVQSESEYYSLTSSQMKVLHTQLAKIPDSLKMRFNICFEQWKQDWSTDPVVQMSSSTAKAKDLKEFAILVKMGKQILPLVVDKLRNKNNFIAVGLYEQLENDPDMKATQGSGQNKAQGIFRKWLCKVIKAERN